MLRRITTIVRTSQHSYISPLLSQNRFYAKKAAKKDKPTAAVILSGCGFLDGTEVTEAVALIAALQRKGLQVQFFAPEGTIEEVYNHSTRTLVKNEIRDIRDEAARIARTRVNVLTAIRPENVDAVFFPGGLGVTRQLSNFAHYEETKSYDISPEVRKIIETFRDLQKPLGFISTAAVLAAKVFGTNNGGKGLKVTLGPKEDPMVNIIANEGVEVVTDVKVKEVCVDSENKIVTTPGFQFQRASFPDVIEGVEKLVDSVFEISGVDETAKYREVVKGFQALLKEDVVEVDAGGRWDHLHKSKKKTVEEPQQE